MKILLRTSLFLILALLAFSCGSMKNVSDSKSGRLGIRDTVPAKDSSEYELIVFDSGFDFWLNSNSHKENMYSNEYLQTMNYQYVVAWNNLYASGDRRIESYLDYSPLTKYNFEFNYRLYMYFKYFEETNRMKLTR